MKKNEVYYSVGRYGNVSNVELTELTLDNDVSGYYLSAKFKVEDDHSTRELSVPKIGLPIKPDKVIISQTVSDWDLSHITSIDLGFGELPLDYGNVYDQRCLFAEKVLEEKVTEMTLDEIEKKLGHKIKIVNK